MLSVLACLCVGCLIDNPAYDPAQTAGSGDPLGTSSDTSGLAADTTSNGATSRDGASGTSSPRTDDSTTSSGPQVTSAAATNSTDDATTSSGAELSESSSGVMGGLQPEDLGQSCDGDQTCAALDIGAECCSVPQCEDRCMVPCTTEDTCPFAGMHCDYGFCLFPCDGHADCAPWPGALCLGGLFCGSD
ncbi:MAG: hypothetical protein ACE37F_00235 [Nannocystaceae bacterium]|nr:hypothetical protein [bacterium]